MWVVSAKSKKSNFLSTINEIPQLANKSELLVEG